MNIKTIISCISIITVNDIISVNITNIYYTRIMILIIIYLLFDIFRIYQDYLDVSKELSIITKNKNNINNIIFAELNYNAIIMNGINTKLIIIENKINNIDNKLKRII